MTLAAKQGTARQLNLLPLYSHKVAQILYSLDVCFGKLRRAGMGRVESASHRRADIRAVYD